MTVCISVQSINNFIVLSMWCCMRSPTVLWGSFWFLPLRLVAFGSCYLTQSLVLWCLVDIMCINPKRTRKTFLFGQPPMFDNTHINILIKLFYSIHMDSWKFAWTILTTQSFHLYSQIYNNRCQFLLNWTAVTSHLCVMIGTSVALNQSQQRGASHYHPMWLRPKSFLRGFCFSLQSCLGSSPSFSLKPGLRPMSCFAKCVLLSLGKSFDSKNYKFKIQTTNI